MCHENVRGSIKSEGFKFPVASPDRPSLNILNRARAPFDNNVRWGATSETADPHPLEEQRALLINKATRCAFTPKKAERLYVVQDETSKPSGIPLFQGGKTKERRWRSRRGNMIQIWQLSIGAARAGERCTTQIVVRCGQRDRTRKSR